MINKLAEDRNVEIDIFDKNNTDIHKALPGKTLKGYTLSGDVIKLTLDSCYVVPETVKQFINYTTIQTGVHLAVTIVMWIGLGLMAVSGTLGIIRKRKQRRVNKQGASAK